MPLKTTYRHRQKSALSGIILTKCNIKRHSNEVHSKSDLFDDTTYHIGSTAGEAVRTATHSSSRPSGEETRRVLWTLDWTALQGQPFPIYSIFRARASLWLCARAYSPGDLSNQADQPRRSYKMQCIDYGIMEVAQPVDKSRPVRCIGLRCKAAHGKYYTTGSPLRSVTFSSCSRRPFCCTSRPRTATIWVERLTVKHAYKDFPSY